MTVFLFVEFVGGGVYVDDGLVDVRWYGEL